MLDSLSVKNFTVFQNAKFNFSPGLNILIGENGTGKSHALKLAYSLANIIHSASSREEGRTKSALQKDIGKKLDSIFRPDYLGRLVHRQQGRNRAEIQIAFRKQRSAIKFGFATNSKTDVLIDSVPHTWPESGPIFIPTHEVISIYKGFAAAYRNREIAFDETYYDLCLALENAPLKGRRFDDVKNLLQNLEDIIDGRVSLANGTFYIGNTETPLVAEGLRKVGMLNYLIANGSLRDKGILFWDEPETNLNPRLIKRIAKTLVTLAAQNIQVITATHSLFLMKEIDLLAKLKETGDSPVHYFGLSRNGGRSVTVQQTNDLESLESIASLEAELEQYEQYQAVPE